MQEVIRKATVGIIRLFVLLAAAIFLPSWTFHYWQGWVCLLAFSVPAVAISVYVAKNDPALLERRVKAGPRAEKETVQKFIQVVAVVFFVGDFAFSSIDHRLGWSHVPLYASIFGAFLMVFGFLIVLEVFKANSYTSGTIEVASGQEVISTGPYAVVRHPMYSGTLVLLLGIPIALGSWWGEINNLGMTAALVLRLLKEEEFLAVRLPGYREYRENVPRRLVPMVW